MIVLCSALLTIGLTGCKDDNTEEPVVKPERVTFSLFADDAYGKELSVTWSAGAQLGVFAGQTQNANFSFSGKEGSGLGDFSGEIMGAAPSYYVYSPYDATAAFQENVLSVKIPEVQTYAEGVVKSKDNPMVGMSTKMLMQMRNLCGVLAVEVEAEASVSVFSITFRAEGQKVAGDGSVAMNYSGDSPELIMSASAGSSVKLNISEAGLTVPTGTTTTFYLVLPPQTYTNAEILVETANSTKQVRIEVPVTITRSRITKNIAHVVIQEAKPAEGVNLNDPARYGISDADEVYSNCYVVDQPGAYFMRAKVIGNGIKGLIPNGGFHTQSVNIAPRSAALVWEEVEGTVTDIRLSEGGGFLLFNAATVPSNAVIAVYDGEEGTGNILWSWHIWLTETPRDQQYKSGGMNTYQVMDRNLGALFSPASTLQVDVDAMTKDERYRCYGLFYQWGRKDPFWGCSAATGLKDKVVYGPMSKRKIVEYNATGDGDNNNLLYAIQQPVTFITSQPGTQWNLSPVDNLWGNPKGYEPSYTKGVKTIYDPCPVGYMIPPVNLWAAAEFDQNFIKMKPSSYGRLFNYDGTNLTWYPLAGIRWAEESDVGDMGSAGNYWSNSVSNATCKFGSELMFTTSSTGTYPISEFGAASGHSIRCIRE